MMKRTILWLWLVMGLAVSLHGQSNVGGGGALPSGTTVSGSNITFPGNVQTKGTDPVVDVTAYGAACDGNFDPIAATISGTDDTTAVQAAVNAIPLPGGTGQRGGAVLYFPRLCRVTSSITLPASILLVRGAGGSEHVTATIPTSGLIYDAATGNALVDSANGLTLQDVGVITRSSDDALHSAGFGVIQLNHATLYQTVGSCSGCLPSASTGNGLSVTTGSEFLVTNHSKITGFNNGILCAACVALFVDDDTMIADNMLGLNAGTTSAVTVIGISHAIMQGNTTGNINIQQGQAINIRDNYFEIQNQSSTNAYDLSVGGTALVSDVIFSGNFTQCNSITTGQAVVLTSVAGFTADGDFWGTCGGGLNIYNNVSSVGVRLSNPKFNGGTPGATSYLGSTTGVLYDDFKQGANLPVIYTPLDLDAGSGSTILRFLLNGSGNYFFNSNSGNTFTVTNNGHLGEVVEQFAASSDGVTSVLSAPRYGTINNCQLGGAAGTTSPAACGGGSRRSHRNSSQSDIVHGKYDCGDCEQRN